MNMHINKKNQRTSRYPVVRVEMMGYNENTPSCGYDCKVMEKCFYHYVPNNKDYSLHPKYNGDDGCKFFKEISSPAPSSPKHGMNERFQDII